MAKRWNNCRVRLGLQQSVGLREEEGPGNSQAMCRLQVYHTYRYYMYYTIDYIYTIYYRKLNKKTKKSSYPVGSIKDNLARLYGSQCFSLLDSAGVSSQLKKKIQKNLCMYYLHLYTSRHFTVCPSENVINIRLRLGHVLDTMVRNTCYKKTSYYDKSSHKQ